MRLYRVVYGTKDGCDGIGYVRKTLSGVLVDAERLAQDPTVNWVAIKVSDNLDLIYSYPDEIDKLREDSCG